MKFKAYGDGLRQEDYETIKKVGRQLTEEVIDIFDLDGHIIESDREDVLLLFGRKAIQASEGKTYLARLELPDVLDLDKDFGSPEHRKIARAAIKKVKGLLGSKSFDEKIEQIAKVNSEILTEVHTPKASKTLEGSKEIEAVVGETSDGKVVKITHEPEMNTADVNMTFTEFRELSKFMEIFGVKEPKIVYKPSSSSRKDSIP